MWFKLAVFLRLPFLLAQHSLSLLDKKSGNLLLQSPALTFSIYTSAYNEPHMFSFLYHIIPLILLTIAAYEPSSFFCNRTRAGLLSVLPVNRTAGTCVGRPFCWENRQLNRPLSCPLNRPGRFARRPNRRFGRRANRSGNTVYNVLLVIMIQSAVLCTLLNEVSQIADCRKISGFNFPIFDFDFQKKKIVLSPTST